MKLSFQSLAALSGCVLLATQAEGLASTMTSYADTACTEELGTASTFGAFVPSAEGDLGLGDFNTCIEVFGASSQTVCDADTGEVGTNTYSDTECSTPLTELAALPSCVEDPECVVGGTCAVSTACTDAEPTAISPNAYNFLADEYDDADCAEPTENQEVVSGDVLFAGLGDGECSKAGTFNLLTECLADGTIILQTFLEDDSTCSGDVVTESTSVAGATGTCDTIEVDGHYYNAISCTTDSATIGEGATGFTPAPTSTVDAGDGDAGTSDTPAPAAMADGDEMSMAPTVADEGNDGSRGLDTSAPTTAGTDGSPPGASGALGVGDGVGPGTAVVTCALGIVATMLAM